MQENHSYGCCDQHAPTGNQHRIRGLRRVIWRADGPSGPRIVACDDNRDGSHSSVTRKGTIMQRQDQDLCKTNSGGDNCLKDHLGLRARDRVPGAQGRFEQRQHHKTTHNCDDRHVKRGHQPVPDFQMRRRHLCRAAQYRTCDQFDKRLCHKRCHANHHDRDHQKRGGQPHACRRIMWLGGIVVADRAKEHMRNQAETVSGREQRPDRRQHGHQPIAAKQDCMIGLFQHHLFRQEPVQQRNTCHRQCRKRRNHKGHGHQGPQPAKAADIACMRLVINDACGHKERGFEGRVVQDVEYRRHRTKGRTGAQKHRDQTQMADG